MEQGKRNQDGKKEKQTVEEKREKQRLYQQKRRQLFSAEEKEKEKQKAREHKQKKRDEIKRDDLQLEEKREKERMYKRQRREMYSVEKKDEERKKERIRKEKQRATLTEEQKIELRDKEREQRQQKQNITTNEEHEYIFANENVMEIKRNNFVNDVRNDIFDLCHSIDQEQNVVRCQINLAKTILEADEEGYSREVHMQKARVCVVCDCFIIGYDSSYWISKETLRFHDNILSASYFYQDGLNSILKSQYSLEDASLSNLLLSPRARKRTSDDSYMCCKCCYDELSVLKRRRSPPKFAISNGFAIGELPESLSKDMTPLVNNLVAPVRAFNYFVSFNGGREQKITGNFTFFAQDPAKNFSAVQHTCAANNNPTVYLVMLGSFTPIQIEKIKKQGTLSVETFKNVYEFLHSNNKHYSNLPPVNNIQTPKIEEIKMSETEASVDHCVKPSVEEHLCWRYWFPNVEEPTSTQGSYRTQSEFAKALFTGETPTLIYHPSKILSNASLSELCPVAFPFGTGDVSCKRSPKVNEVECLQHYLKLSLPQFQEGQTILIIHHIFQRRKSFMSGITKCNVSKNGNTISDQLAAMTIKELDEAITQMKNISKSNLTFQPIDMSTRVSQLLHCIKTSCIPIGYTNEASLNARNKMFALWITFGPPSLLFTFSPCDECSFKMQLFATGKSLKLPSVLDSLDLMTINLGLRKSLRVRYPGACAREFDSLLRIVIHDLIGWEENEQKEKGIFGKILASSTGVEEQGRTTLHGHIILWVFNHHLIQQLLFSADSAIRNKAINEIQEYMRKVLSSEFYIKEEEFKSNLHSESDVDNVGEVCGGEVTGVSLQQLREMRHRQYLKSHQGKVVTCNKCEKSWNTEDVVNSAIKYLFEESKKECPTFWPEHVTFPLQHEFIELLAFRYQYDMAHIPIEAKSLRRLLQLIVLLFFNTHDWRHRKACFKKGNECRFHIPHKPCEDLSVTYKAENLEDMICGMVSGKTSKWYHHNGSHHNVCGYEIQPKRKSWDVFLNTNSPVITNVLGYNSNICMGSINTLFYCTLYTSKSNQEEETYPYLKACEAVSTRIRKLDENNTEQDLSMKQIGLRRLLSGINAHLSSCVVSATMAWYLVTHGTRFHFSHQFKPLLLTQFEAWYNEKDFCRRIRYKKYNNKSKTGQQSSATTSDSGVWFDSDVNNYLHRPTHPMFNNMSLWEYQAKYDMITYKPELFMKWNDNTDITQHHFRFHKDHPGYQYCCLVQRKHECVPQLYYSNKFPDIESLQIENNDNVDSVLCTMRETYALKALLMFFPFKERNDILSNFDNLWNKLQHLKRNHQQRCASGQLSLYEHAPHILQNIQDLLNVRKIPSAEDILESCTNISDEEILCKRFKTKSTDTDNFVDQESCHFEAAIDQLSQYVNLLSQESSIFNNNIDQLNYNHDPVLQNGIITIKSSTIDTSSIVANINEHIEHGKTLQDSSLCNRRHCEVRSIISVITKALQQDNIDLFHGLTHRDTTDNDRHDERLIDIPSLDEFALRNKLDPKQNIAFQTICSSFMLSFCLDTTPECPLIDIKQIQKMLRKKGGKEQLVMFLTGPGGSGKSHIIKCCRLYCKTFCDAIGKPFDYSVFPVTATSNSAASLLQGKTIHTAAMLNNRVVDIRLSSEVSWTTTKILIIDEISMAPKTMLRELDKNLRILTGNREFMYGGIHLIFIGDFMQLPPVSGSPIYNDFEDIHWHGTLNACIFLDQGNHRFKEDDEWGEILKRVQIGSVTEEDIMKLNSRVVPKVQLPSSVDCNLLEISYACYTNKRRNRVTNECFLHFIQQHCPAYNTHQAPTADALIIKGLVTKEGKDLGEDFHKCLWAVCGDDNINNPNQQKIDPCLKLIIGCPLMINSNNEKERKLYKGTTGKFAGVRWKEGCNPVIEDYYGHKVFSSFVSDFESLYLQLDTTKAIVEIRPEVFTVSIRFPSNKKTLKGFKIFQFPVNLSLAVTGHKLQGMSRDLLIVTEITNRVPNWLYVVLSRVTTLTGLYLLHPLEKSMFKPLSKKITEELKWLRSLEMTFIHGLEVNHLVEKI